MGGRANESAHHRIKVLRLKVGHALQALKHLLAFLLRGARHAVRGEALCARTLTHPCTPGRQLKADIDWCFDNVAPLHSSERRAVPPARWSCTRGDAARRAPVVAHPCSEVFGSLAEPQGLAVVTPQQSPWGSVDHPPEKWSMDFCLAVGSLFQAFIER